MWRRCLTVVFAIGLLALTGCPALFHGGGSTTQPLNHSQMVQVATFENTLVADTEGRLMDAFQAGLLPSKLHADLDPYVKAARSAADQLTIAANNPATTPDAFQLILDQLTAALGPLSQANAQAVQVKRGFGKPTTVPGHVMPSVYRRPQGV